MNFSIEILVDLVLQAVWGLQGLEAGALLTLPDGRTVSEDV
jgi:hypothetical protein